MPVAGRGKKMLLSFIHANCFKIERRDLWSELAAITVASLPLLVVGDFNATLLSNEKKGPRKFNVGLAAEFQAMVDSCMLISTPSQSKKYTWSNNRRRGNVMAALDRSFHNELWIDEFKNISQREISGNPIFILSQKLKRVKLFIKPWGRKNFPNIDNEVKKASDHLNSVHQEIEAAGMSDDLFGREADAKTALLKATQLQDNLWAQKAKLRWMKDGDKNSKFFHLSVKMRRARNQIRTLQNADGEWMNDQQQLSSYIVNYYEEFHRLSVTSPHLELLDCIPCIISDDDALYLEAEPSLEEIKKAVWELDPDSSPGPDGFSGNFFRRVWSIVEVDFCKAVLHFFRWGILPKGVNNFFLTLIPKVVGATSLDKYRPICMGNYFCKVLSKIVASRVAILLPKLISEEQGAFQKGKIISENISLASELANLMHSTVRGGGMGLKVDVQKAYDSLSWEFLFAVLGKFGFPRKWISWIQGILSSSRISVLINGGPEGFFGVGRGLRQGDPLSPILFILAEEVLCRGLNKLALEGSIKSLPGPRGTCTPTHLLFADDIFIFMNASAKYVKNLHLFLSKYQDFSGQHFNLDKSKAFFGKVAPHRKQFISNLLGIQASKFPTRYLGVEIFKGRVKKNHLLPLMDKIKCRLAAWKGKLLSMAGRVELVRSVISSIPIHNFAVYWWPQSIIKTVERARFVQKDGSLRKGYKSSSILPGLKRVWKFVSDMERWTVGNGEKIMFWTDKWLENSSLAESSKLEQEMFIGRTMRLADLNRNGEWSFPNVSSKFLAETFEKAKIISLSSMEDICHWKLSNSGAFSLRSAWEEIRGKNQKFPWFSILWKSKIQPRQAVFGWRLAHNRLPTDEEVRRRGVMMPSRWQPLDRMGDFLAWWKRKGKNFTFSTVWLCGFILIPYAVWMERNARYHDGPALHYKHIFARVKGEICMISSVYLGKPLSIPDLICARRIGIPRVTRTRREIIEVRWCLPFPGWIKLNTDGCSLGNPGKAGAGGIFRNEKGDNLLNYREYVGIRTNFEAEFLAVIAGLEQAKINGFQHLWIECDSTAVVILLSKGLVPWFALQRWRSLLSFLNSINWKVTHCYREANVIADFLAKSSARFEVSYPVEAWPRLVSMELELDANQRPRYRFMNL
ncbi:uncharacterized protein LOC122067264 [Macadamia integrifolia]|uniref:uncharacterized protein LOC122067264 n=1 Tax=Macadamia integrifolia TaxID=60698 RepID=UPI001C4F2B2F|nr:uncharacterized protein LOC122067264 [Macadamia integrifolia]